ncbi:patatin [Bacteroidia bacterium]|nr:patatin [Bacteroidia bacterium]
MTKRLFTFILLLLQVSTAFAQQTDESVGMVMSGGGAKGAVHIGILKALEENDVPIDYIAGTSIGAMVGGLYAIGYSPDEILSIFMSREFYYWQTGTVEDAYQYYFRQQEPNPAFVRFNVPLNNPMKASLTDAILPNNSLINPIQMNLAFMQVFTQAATKSDYDFDKLFVPFLCVASNVYTKESVLFRNGDLGYAVRASMTFPLFFKPLMQDGVPLWDGGIYDNFPVGQMQKAWRPNVIIGSSVAGSSVIPENQSLFEQITDIAMQKTDYSIDPREGLLMKFELPGVGLMDFQRLQELFDLGYNTAISMMDSIKGRVHRQVPQAEVQARREAYKASLPPLIFKDVHIQGKGVSDAQKYYLMRQIHRDPNATFTLEEFKRIYFRLLTNSTIREIMPRAEYDPASKTYSLHLDVTVNNDLTVEFGGDVSSSAANQMYIGLNYRSLALASTNFNVDVHLGNAYSAVFVQGKYEGLFHIPFDISAQWSFHVQDYFDSNKFFLDTDLATFSNQQENFGKLGLGIPIFNNAKLEFLGGYGIMYDTYFQDNLHYLTGNDKSEYQLINLGLYLKKNTTDAKQFPTSGQKAHLTAQFITGQETFKPSYAKKVPRTTMEQSYIQLNAGITNYHDIDEHLKLGWLVQGVASNKQLWNNYTSSILQAPSFTPTPHSALVLNEAFHSNDFVAAGILPIWKFNSTLHLRGELYGFLPLRPLEKQDDGSGKYGGWLYKSAFMGEASVVAQFPFMSVSAFINLYSYPTKNWNFGVNIGYLIFDQKFIQ